MRKKATFSQQKRGITRDSKYFREFNLFAKRVRENIRRLRTEKGLTQEKMEEFEINLRQFQRIESGETINITLMSLFKMAKAYNVNIIKLFE